MSDFHKKRFVTMSELDEARFNKEKGKEKQGKEAKEAWEEASKPAEEEEDEEEEEDDDDA